MKPSQHKQEQAIENQLEQWDDISGVREKFTKPNQYDQDEEAEEVIASFDFKASILASQDRRLKLEESIDKNELKRIHLRDQLFKAGLSEVQLQTALIYADEKPNPYLKKELSGFRRFLGLPKVEVVDGMVRQLLSIEKTLEKQHKELSDIIHKQNTLHDQIKVKHTQKPKPVEKKRSSAELMDERLLKLKELANASIPEVEAELIETEVKPSTLLKDTNEDEVLELSEDDYEIIDEPKKVIPPPAPKKKVEPVGRLHQNRGSLTSGGTTDTAFAGRRGSSGLAIGQRGVSFKREQPFDTVSYRKKWQHVIDAMSPEERKKSSERFQMVLARMEDKDLSERARASLEKLFGTEDIAFAYALHAYNLDRAMASADTAWDVPTKQSIVRRADELLTPKVKKEYKPIAESDWSAHLTKLKAKSSNELKPKVEESTSESSISVDDEAINEDQLVDDAIAEYRRLRTERLANKRLQEDKEIDDRISSLQHRAEQEVAESTANQKGFETSDGFIEYPSFAVTEEDKASYRKHYIAAMGVSERERQNEQRAHDHALRLSSSEQRAQLAKLNKNWDEHKEKWQNTEEPSLAVPAIFQKVRDSKPVEQVPETVTLKEMPLEVLEKATLDESDRVAVTPPESFGFDPNDDVEPYEIGMGIQHQENVQEEKNSSMEDLRKAFVQLQQQREYPESGVPYSVESAGDVSVIAAQKAPAKKEREQAPLKEIHKQLRFMERDIKGIVDGFTGLLDPEAASRVLYKIAELLKLDELKSHTQEIKDLAISELPTFLNELKEELSTELRKLFNDEGILLGEKEHTFIEIKNELSKLQSMDGLVSKAQKKIQQLNPTVLQEYFDVLSGKRLGEKDAKGKLLPQYSLELQSAFATAENIDADPRTKLEVFVEYLLSNQKTGVPREHVGALLDHLQTLVVRTRAKKRGRSTS